MNWNQFLNAVRESYNFWEDEETLTKLQDAFYNTEKDVENEGNEELDQDGWWEIAIINIEQLGFEVK